ncbi:hypothetical protein GQR58_029726 [Nymphon striatum]|nr:hypothetical protein GQR58_029726 [Nymphon striatum]
MWLVPPPTPAAAFAVGTTTAQIVWRKTTRPHVTIDVADGPTVEVPTVPGKAPGSVIIEGLIPDRSYKATVSGCGRDQELSFQTLPTFQGPELARVATINDLHLGSTRFGLSGRMSERPKPEVPNSYRAAKAAVDEAVAWGAQHLVIKGDLVHKGDTGDWDLLARLLDHIPIPVTLVPGNHESRRGMSQTSEKILAGLGHSQDNPVHHAQVPGLRMIAFDSTVRDEHIGRVGHVHDALLKLHGVSPRGAFGDQASVLHDVPGPVEGKDANELVVAAIGNREAALFDRAGDHERFVVGTGAAGKLDLAVVLIAPEPWHRCVGLRFVVGLQKSAGSMHAHLHCVVPVLDAHHFVIEALVGPAGHITSSNHSRCGQAGGVANNAVVHGEARAFEPLGVGDDTNTNDHHIGVEGGAIGKGDRTYSSVTFEGIDAYAQPQVHALLHMQVGADLTHLGTKNTLERHGGHLHHGDIEPAELASVAAAVRSGPLHDGVFAVQHHHCAALGGHVIEVRGDNLTRRHRLFFGVGSDDKRHQNVVGSQAALLAGRSAPCSPTPGWRRSRPHTPEGRPPSPRPRHLDQQPAPQDPPCNQILLQAWAGGGMRHRAIGRAILDSFGRLRNAHQAGGHHGVACERATRWVDLCTFLIDTQSVHKHVLVGGKRGVQLGNVDLVVGHASALAGLDSRWSSGEVSRPEMMHIDAQQPGLKRRHRKGIGPQRRNVIRIELGGQHIAQRPRAGLAVAIDQRSVDLAHLQLHPLLRTAQRRRPSPHGFR